MIRFDHTIVEQVASLELPHPDRVMITHGSALRVRGVSVARDTDIHYDADIDLVTDNTNLAHIKHALGWTATAQRQYYPEDMPENIRCIVSPDGKYDVFGHDFIGLLFERKGRGRIYPNELFARHDARFDQDESTGIWVASLDHVVATKMGTTRQKDVDDIRRVQQFETYGY